MKTFAAVAALALLAGCASQQQPKADAPAAPVSAATAATAPAPKMDARMAALEAAKKRVGQVEPAVYFDFDKFNVKPEYNGVVSAFGELMTIDTNAKLLLEGNADERGTVEYNLALGQRRAEAVAASLKAVGVKAENIEAISNGEEKPRNTASTSEAFAQNRRVDLIIR